MGHLLQGRFTGILVDWPVWGLELAELGALAGGLNNRSVGAALRYLEEAQKQNPQLRRFVSQAGRQIKNKEI